MSHPLLERREILVACGTGGVGKTTLSAALALHAAIQGKRALVITIDPAKRLANALGVKAWGDDPIDLTQLLKDRLSQRCEIRGTLHAVMPDTRETFEHFIRALTPSELLVNNILKNPIFQIFAKEFSGTNEYMALQRLNALAKSGQYDCIILDTPPSRNTLAFLNAPSLLSRLFEDRMIHWIAAPANRLVSGGLKKALGVLEKLTGSGFMTHLFDFFSALFAVRVNFLAHLKEITTLLESERVGFFVVTTPANANVQEIQHFADQVRERKFRFDGIFLNRSLSELRRSASDGSPRSATLDRASQILNGLQDLERRTEIQLQNDVGQIHGRLPELARDVHSVEDLFHVAMAIDSTAAEFHARRRE